MKYPMKEERNPFTGGTIYREMSPAEYDAQIQWYKNFIKEYENDTARRYQEYVGYLRRWFGEGPCDGLPNFKARHTLHKLPMSMNIYFN